MGELERFVFEVKKLQNGKKYLKTVKSEAQSRSEKTTATEKHVSASIARNPQKANGSLLTPIRRCTARI